MMSPCSCQPVTRSSPLSTLRCCATLLVPEQDRVTDAQCSKEAPAVSLSPAAKGNCGRDSPCLSKKLLWGKIWSHYKYRRLNCGTARIWSIPTPGLPESPHFCILATTVPLHSQREPRPILLTLLVVVSCGYPLRHLELNTDSSTFA